MPPIRFGSEIAAIALRAVYDQSRGRYRRPVSFEQLTTSTGLTAEELLLTARALQASGYLTNLHEASCVALEHAGLDWVERNPLTGEPDW